MLGESGGLGKSLSMHKSFLANRMPGPQKNSSPGSNAEIPAVPAPDYVSRGLQRAASNLHCAAFCIPQPGRTQRRGPDHIQSEGGVVVRNRDAEPWPAKCSTTDKGVKVPFRLSQN